MYLSSDMYRALLHAPTEKQRVRMASLRADMEAFVRGDAITICFTPRKAKTATFGRLDPPGEATWDLRARVPSPSLRVLGMFATVDAFVAFDWWPRRRKVEWSDKEPLSDGKDLRWRLAIHDCRERWHKILPGEIPVSGTDVRKYVTRNVDVLAG